MSYPRLVEHYRRIAHLEHIGAIVEWDRAVMMPAAAGEHRAEAVATFDGVRHQLATDPRILGWLSDAEARVGALDDAERANLREMRRSWVQNAAIPPDLVEAAARAEALCEQAWRVQRQADDWAGHRPLLENVVARKREVASALGDELGTSPYDALLDLHEPGLSAARIDPVFEELSVFLPDFMQQVIERQRTLEVCVPEGPFPVDAQRALGLELMTRTGFDAQTGRLDVSHHPFCGGVPSDVRITTRYDERDFTSALMGVLHEAGHAKYEQGLPSVWRDQSVGKARGMAVHESQSLLQEMSMSRSREFIRFALPAILRAFPDAVGRNPRAFTEENLFRVYTRVSPSLVRVEADEVTYSLHVILRYQIERALIGGEVEVTDIPELWNAKMTSMLGLATAGDYKNGCMQDIHWPAGAFGYFPVYTLGALMAAQLYRKASSELPDLPTQISEGRFDGLNAWLSAAVWSRGSMLDWEQLLTEATGGPLETTAFVEHLRSRYLEA